MARKSKSSVGTNKTEPVNGLDAGQKIVAEWVAANRDWKPSEKTLATIDRFREHMRDLNAEWVARYGQPMPATIEEWKQEATRAGVPVSHLLNDNWTARSLAPFIEGHLQRLQDEVEVAALRLTATGPKETPAPIVANVQAGTVTVNGVEHRDVSPTTCGIVHELLEAKGRDVRWCDLEKRCGMRGKNQKREMDEVREIIGDHLMSSRTGYRITF